MFVLITHTTTSAHLDDRQLCWWSFIGLYKGHRQIRGRYLVQLSAAFGWPISSSNLFENLDRGMGRFSRQCISGHSVIF